jgi:putative restriction endonuclease
MVAMDVKSEIARRLELWRTISHENSDELEPGRLRDLVIYGGAQGIWVNKAYTAIADEAPDGITVSVLHTGRHYADDLSEDGVIYHYPMTNRQASRDASEVQATKNAMNLHVPIFIVLPSRRSSQRSLKIGWVSDFDDENRQFLILFSSEIDASNPPPYKRAEAPNEPFKLEDDNRQRKQTSLLVRTGQQRFRFHVMSKYGSQCAVCKITHPQLIVAAHIRGKAHKGSDDWRNGIVLCATHHDAFDNYLFGIEPQTLELRVRPNVDAEQIGIQFDKLQTLKNCPHNDALQWRWQETLKEWA